MELNEVVAAISKVREELRRKFMVSRIGVFGSYARHEQTPGSDIDILVEFEKPVGMFNFFDTEDFLHNLLGLKVDLVTRKALHPLLKDRILKETFFI